MREDITAPNAAPRPPYHSRSQAWNSASLQGSESSRMCAFMQAFMRPCPGATSPQNCLISGLHALAAAIAPGRICAIAPDAESSKMAQMLRTRLSIVLSPFLLSEMPYDYCRRALLLCQLFRPDPNCRSRGKPRVRCGKTIMVMIRQSRC